jgi:hypothetical protein
LILKSIAIFNKKQIVVNETEKRLILKTFENAIFKDSLEIIKLQNEVVDKIVHELYTRIIITRKSTGYYYKFDDSYQGNTSTQSLTNNVTINGNNVNIKLYQVASI